MRVDIDFIYFIHRALSVMPISRIRKVFVFVALPAICLLWFIGWSLYYNGSRKS